MRMAVLSDIHGNLRALEAVQADLKTQSPDLVINLGDHLSGPLEAGLTADLLMSENYLSIRGNHDRQLLDRPLEKMGASDAAAYPQLTPRHLAWLAELPPTLAAEPDIFLCHGTPASDLEYLLEEIHPEGLRLTRQPKNLPPGANLVLCGHSHIPRAVTAASTGTLIVNPGSVGLQAYEDIHPWPHYVETGSPHSRYAILDQRQHSWRVQFLMLEYDWHAAAAEARKNHRPDWAHALATGYAARRG